MGLVPTKPFSAWGGGMDGLTPWRQSVDALGIEATMPAPIARFRWSCGKRGTPHGTR